jgi:hypothetical protein
VCFALFCRASPAHGSLSLCLLSLVVSQNLARAGRGRKRLHIRLLVLLLVITKP